MNSTKEVIQQLIESLETPDRWLGDPNQDTKARKEADWWMAKVLKQVVTLSRCYGEEQKIEKGLK